MVVNPGNFMKLDRNRAVLNITARPRDNARRTERRQVATDVNFHDGASFVDNDANRNNNYSVLPFRAFFPPSLSLPLFARFN